jgi:hypothetical protein
VALLALTASPGWDELPSWLSGFPAFLLLLQRFPKSKRLTSVVDNGSI